MDWLSHYMIAFLIGRKMELDDQKLQAFTLGALILDIDIIYYLFPGTIIPIHGTLSHTLIGALLFGGIGMAAMWIWKRKFLGVWVAVGIVSHLMLDMLNTLSAYDSGKELLYPISEATYSLEGSVPYPYLIWAIVSAAIFSFSLVMAGKLTMEGEPPWRIWFDERPLLEKYRTRRSGPED